MNSARSHAGPASSDGPSPRTSAILERSENALEEFEEACGHVLKRPEFSRIRLGPVRDLRIDEIRPGVVGWTRTLSEARSKRSSQIGPRPASLSLMVVPTSSESMAHGLPESPLRSVPRSELLAVGICRGFPRRVVLAYGGPPTVLPDARDLVEAVRAEMDEE
jgi:hypothetical protein